ncbi:MAG: protein kinase [Planctomycetales bacterium]|nr:protein kinase [Planctomycetales bacterium]
MDHRPTLTANDHWQADANPAEVLQDLLTELTDASTEVTPNTIDDFVSRYPQHEAAIRKMAPAVLAMNCFIQFQGERSANSQVPRQLGEYRVIRQIARGGIGIVFEAEQLSLSRRVALKILPFAALYDATQVARFRNEALAAARLRHPNIVSVYEVGLDQGTHFYAMELVRGQDLSRLLARPCGSPDLSSCDLDKLPQVAKSTITLPTSIKKRSRFAAELGLQIASALAYAHREGVIHRDIKPSNLILDDYGKLWITDFGLARLQSESGLTASNHVLGTLKYMSPEQAAGDLSQVDHRADIFALGVTLYELVTCRPMRVASTPQELLRQTLAGLPPGFGPEKSQVARDLQTIISCCTAREPQDRYQSATDLAYDLESFLQHRPIRATSPGWTERSLKWCRHNPTITVSCATSLVVILMLGASFFWIFKERSNLDLEKRLREQQASQLEDELLRTRNDQYVSNIHLAFNYWKSGLIAEMRDQLALAVPADNEVDLRGFEWHYLKALVDSILKPIGRHEGMAYYVEYVPGTPDCFVTAGDDGLRIWKDGKQLNFIDQTPLGSQWIDFSSDGTQMLSASGKQVILWDTTSWKVVNSFQCELVALAAEFVHGQENIVIVERPEGLPDPTNSIVRLVDLRTGKDLWRDDQMEKLPDVDLAEGVAIASNMNLVIIAYSDGEVRVRDLSTGTLLSSVHVESGVGCVACSPSEKWLAIGSKDGMTSIRPLASKLGAEVLAFKAASNGISSLQYFDDRHLVAASHDGTVAHYRVSPQDAAPIAELDKRFQFEFPLWACRLDENEYLHLATVDRAGHVSVRSRHAEDVQNPMLSSTHDFSKGTAEQKRSYASSSHVFGVSSDSDYAVSHDFVDTLFIWDLHTNEYVRELTVSEMRKSAPTIPAGIQISHAGFLPKSRRILINLEGRAFVVFDTESGDCGPWLSASHAVKSYSPPAFQPYGNWLAMTKAEYGDTRTLVFDSQNVVREIVNGVRHVTWGHDGSYLIQDRTTGDFTVTDVRSWEDTRQFVGSSFAQPAISPDGRTLATSDEAEIILLSLPSGREMLRIPLRTANPNSLHFSNHGTRLTAEYIENQNASQAVWTLAPFVKLSP